MCTVLCNSDPRQAAVAEALERPRQPTSAWQWRGPSPEFSDSGICALFYLTDVKWGLQDSHGLRHGD